MLPDAPPVAITRRHRCRHRARRRRRAALAAAAAIPIATAVLLPDGPIGHLPRATAVPALSEGSMVSAEEALTAVMEAAKLTSQAYDAVMHAHSERHRQETESLGEEIARQHEHSERHRRETLSRCASDHSFSSSRTVSRVSRHNHKETLLHVHL